MGRNLLEHKNWLPGTPVLFDHSKLDFTQVSKTDLQIIRLFHQKNDTKIGNGKSAIVVGENRAQLWYQLWDEGDKISALNFVKIFEKINLAHDWIMKCNKV